MEPIDTFSQHNTLSPLIVLALGYFLCHLYPQLKNWNTARGDTIIIIGTVAGFTVGSFFNNKLGLLQKSDKSLLYDIQFSTTLCYLLSFIRTILGLLLPLLIRQLFKLSLLRFLCHIYKLDFKDPNSKKQNKIEIPYYYLTYFTVGLSVALASPYLFRLLGIQRKYSYTEL